MQGDCDGEMEGVTVFEELLNLDKTGKEEYKQ